MNRHLIDRLVEEWVHLDPVDPLRGLISDVIAEINKQPAQQEPVAYEYGEEVYWHTNPALNDYIRANGKELVYATPPAAQPAPVQEPVAGKGKELSEQLKLCARNVAFVAAGRVDMSSAAMQEMFALIDHVCVGLDSPRTAQRQWVGLTDEEMYLNCPNWLSQENCKTWVQQIETKLKEKNA